MGKEKVLENDSKTSVRADGGNRTHDPEITNHVLWPTELHRQYWFPFERGCKDMNFCDKPYIYLIFFYLIVNLFCFKRNFFSCLRDLISKNI